MTGPVADDGVGWNQIDNLALWLLPAFLAYVGGRVADDGVAKYISIVVGVVAGVAVVRGIQAAINSRKNIKPASPS